MADIEDLFGAFDDAPSVPAPALTDLNQKRKMNDE